jgi:hypothetical protein
MQTKKMNLANMKGKLNRAEMKNIMAGSYGSPSCGELCSSDSHCSTNQSCSKCLSGLGPNGGCGCGNPGVEDFE